jgi:type III secretion protein J
LVTSPGQEQTKIVYLKEQSLERMLSDMEGVVSARVVIAQPEENDNDDGSAPEASSVAAFIKYAPNVTVNNSITQIKGLIHASVPALGFDKISVVLQPTQYLMETLAPTPPMTPERILQKYSFWIVIGILVSGWMGYCIYLVYGRIRKSAVADEDKLA